MFWDNQKGNKQFTVPRRKEMPLIEFGGGADLESVGGVCTECHAGENPFVIHPNTALGLPELMFAIRGDMNSPRLPLFARDWYEPLVKPSWPQNPGPIDSPGRCALCHRTGGEGGRFPQISPDLGAYCNAILRNAISRTMPPAPLVPGSLRKDPHPRALLAMCDWSISKPVKVRPWFWALW